MDSLESRNEALVRAVGASASELRAWLRDAGPRHRMNARRSHALIERAALLHDRPARQHDREQAEVDREARCSARRMAHDGRWAH